MAPTRSMPIFQSINIMIPQQIPENTAKIETSSYEPTTSKSLRSASFFGRFQSAVSVQRSFYEPEARNEVAQEVEAICSVLHAFRTALEVLARLVKQQQLYPSAIHLERSLSEGEKEFKGTHEHRFRLHGRQYMQRFTSSSLRSPSTG